MERWQAPGSGQIVRASVSAGGRLLVLFGDASWVEVDGARLLPPSALAPEWNALSVDEYGDFILVPTADGVVDIPADRIRVMTDPIFAEHRASLAEAEAGRIGRRLQLLRERSGLTAREVARRAGISATSLNRIELGRHEIDLTTLAQILAAIGCEFDDLEAPASTMRETDGKVQSETAAARRRQTTAT